MKLTQLQEARYVGKRLTAEDAAYTLIQYISQNVPNDDPEDLYFALMLRAKRDYRVHNIFDEELVDKIIEEIAYGETT